MLATYDWKEVNKRFYAPFDQSVTHGSWPVKLKSRMYNGDVVFLAHMKYDSYTITVNREIDQRLFMYSK